jgi:hypothetical protein
VHVRERWAASTNEALQEAQVAARVDHRTLQAQGIDREPALHIPRAAFEMERHGYRSSVAERMREDHQARVELRLQRAAQQAPAVGELKSPEEIRMQAVENWLRYRQAHVETAQAEAVPADAAKRTREKDHSL